MSALRSLFESRSVAVVGASTNPAKLGHSILKNIIEGGFTGSLYALNPTGAAVLDVPGFASVTEVPQELDLVVVVVPAAAVLSVARECGEAKVKNLVVITAGFGELGEAGQVLEQQLRHICAEAGMRLLGPNCLGVIAPPHALNASFAGAMPPAGDIAVLSQSGAMCTAILDWAKDTHLGFSAFVSLGNKADITEHDLLEAWSADAQTKVVLGYLEGIADGKRFIEAARALTQQKPFVLIKAGSSEAGSAAVSSHTGTVTGSEDALQAAVRRSGITRARTIEEVFDFATAFANAPLPAEKRVAIVTNAGGAGVLTTDAVGESGLQMATISADTTATLTASLPAEANVHNPIDCIGDARADRYQAALSAVLADEGVDAVIVLLTPQAVTEVSETAEVIVQLAAASAKPILASFIGGAMVAPGLQRLRSAGVPAYETPERAVKALQVLSDYAAYRRRPQPARAVMTKADVAATGTITSAQATGKSLVVGEEAVAILQPYGITDPRIVHVTSAPEAAAAATEMGFPVVMKIDSPDIIHKSDVGGVTLDLQNAAEVEQAYAAMMQAVAVKAPEAQLVGVSLMEQVPEGLDFLVGGKRDADFGPVVVFGFGGIYVEVFRDVAYEIAPFSQDEARQMIERVKSAALLHGARGSEPLDIEAVQAAIVGVGNALLAHPAIQELDLNPLRVFTRGALSLDTRILLAPPKTR